MIKLMTVNYLESIEEAKIKPLKGFYDMDLVIQMDCIIDAIYELNLMRDELDKVMYPKDEEETKCQL